MPHYNNDMTLWQNYRMLHYYQIHIIDTYSVTSVTESTIFITGHKDVSIFVKSALHKHDYFVLSELPI